MKRYLILTACILSFLFLLCSCRIGGGGGSGDGQTNGGSAGDSGSGDSSTSQPGAVDENAILKSGGEVSLIYNSSLCDATAITELSAALTEITGKAPTAGDSTLATAKHEIVIGSTEREITGVAEDLLDKAIARRIRRSDDYEDAAKDLIGYAVYSDGESVAVVWTHDYLKGEAVNYFTENYLVSDSLTLEDGYIKTSVLSFTEFVEELDEKRVEAAWATLEEQLGEGSEATVSALRGMHALFDDELIDWYANLYDPEVGGFYHANSARDNDGFLPDAETTNSALGIIVSTGMTWDYSDNYADYVPDWLREQVLNFIFSLHHPDGYFYHPQWGKNVPNSRRARDLDVCTRMLESFGATLPENNFPVSLKGSLTHKKSSDAAVSAVVAASTVPEPYQSVEQYTNYVKEMVVTDPYTLGNFLQSGYPEIVKYGSMLGANLLKITFEILEEHQNKQTGIWSDEFDWHATDALHKLTSFYNKAGRALPNVDKAINTVFLCLETDEETQDIVQTPNAWACFRDIKANVKFRGGTKEEQQAVIDAMTEQIREMAAKGIAAATADMSTFKKDDGSFSYFKKFSASQIQGVRGAVPSTVEGDANGTGMALDLVTSIHQALGVEEYMVPLYTEADRYRYLGLLEELSPALKNVETVKDPYTIDFEESSLGIIGIPGELRYDANESLFEIIEENEGTSSANKCLLVDARDWYTLEGWGTSKRNAYFSIDTNPVHEKPNSATFSFDIEFSRANSGLLVNIQFANTQNQIVAALKLYGMTEGRFAYIKVYDAKDNDLGLKLPMDTKINFRMDYYTAEGVIQIFINDLFFGETKNITTPGAKIDSANFALLGNADTRLKVDNIVTEKGKKNFEGELTANKFVFPEPVMGRPIYDFEDSDAGEIFPEDLLVDKKSNVAEIVDVDGSKKLYLVGTDFYYHDSDTPGVINWNTKNYNPRVTVFAHPTDEAGNAYVLEYEMKMLHASIQSPAGTNVYRISFYDALDRVFMTFNFRYETVGSTTYIKLFDAANTNTELVRFTCGETVRLRLEYFPEEGAVKVYFGEQYVALSKNGAVSLPRKVLMGIETGANTEMYIDDVVFVRDTIDFGTASPTPLPPPAAPELPDAPDSKPLYDFEDVTDVSSLTAGLVLGKRSGIAELLTVAGNKKLRLVGTDWYYHDSATPGVTNWDTKKYNPYIDVLTYTNAKDGGAFLLTFDLTVSSASIQSPAGSRIMHIAFRDSLGNEHKQFMFVYYVDAGGQTRLQIVDSANAHTPIIDFATGEEISVKILYKIGKEVEVYLGEELKGSIAIDSSAVIAKAQFYIATGANVDLTLDNVGFTRENLSESDDTEGDDDGNGEEAGALGVYDFEGSAVGSILPEGVTATAPTGNCQNNAAGAVIAEKDGNKYLKVVTRDSYYNYQSSVVDWNLSGKNPTVSFEAATVGEEGYFTVEMDIKFVEALTYSVGSGETSMAILFYNGTEKIKSDNSPDIGIRLYKPATGASTIGIRDNMTAEKYTEFSIADTLHFTFEYKEGRMYYTVNGVNLGSWPVKYSEITRMDIQFMGAAHAELEIDNVKIFNN